MRTWVSSSSGQLLRRLAGPRSMAQGQHAVGVLTGGLDSNVPRPLGTANTAVLPMLGTRAAVLSGRRLLSSTRATKPNVRNRNLSQSQQKRRCEWGNDEIVATLEQHRATSVQRCDNCKHENCRTRLFKVHRAVILLLHQPHHAQDQFAGCAHELNFNRHSIKAYSQPVNRMVSRANELRSRTTVQSWPRPVGHPSQC